jgi:hypothetical protein
LRAWWTFFVPLSILIFDNLRICKIGNQIIESQRAKTHCIDSQSKR